MLSASGEFLTPMASIWSVRIMWCHWWWLLVTEMLTLRDVVMWCCQHGVTWTIERSHCWLLAVSLSLSLSHHHRPTVES